MPVKSRREVNNHGNCCNTYSCHSTHPKEDISLYAVAPRANAKTESNQASGGQYGAKLLHENLATGLAIISDRMGIK